MQLIEIDKVSLQTFKRSLNRSGNRLTGNITTTADIRQTFTGNF